MTDKAKERIQRQCLHNILLRVQGDNQLHKGLYECADCQKEFDLRVPVLEESAT